MPDFLTIAGKTFSSRLLVGTGKFPSLEVMQQTLLATGSQIVTISLRRINPEAQEDILDFIPSSVQLLPNTSGARNAQEAILLAQLCRKAAGTAWIKLELTSDSAYLLPDPIETLKAAEQLVKEGFTVLPYMPADPVLAKKLEEVGCAAVMPLGSPIGTNRGLETKEMIGLIVENSQVPVVVDAGLGAPSHAAEAFELGVDAVLVNTALAVAGDPVAMGAAFKKACEAGREGFLAKLGSQSDKAQASSPLTGFLFEQDAQ